MATRFRRARISLWASGFRLLASVVILLGCAGLGFAQQDTALEPAGPAVTTPSPADIQTAPSAAPWLPTRRSDYWLGVFTEPVPEAVRSHLGLKPNEGLLVQEVAPDSPAARAKLQRFDILLKVKDKPLSKIDDLIAALDAGKGEKLTLEVLRGGKPMKVEVTPAKRPPGEVSALLPPGAIPPHEAFRKWFGWIVPGEGRRPDYSLVFPRPGIVLMHPAGSLPDLPNNVSIMISKQGTSLAKIVVTRDSEKWEVSENELDKLPTDVRAHVEPMIRHDLRWLTAPPIQPHPSAPPAKPAPKAELRSEKRAEPRSMPAKPVDKRVDELSRQLEELRKAVETLKQGSAAKAPGAPAAPKLEAPAQPAAK